ncbi:hypothetical protein FGIG_06685 [Fasciola gigantica]|uniref:Uncharacterized protein n=1 Tax=Fasciola gigantica TaxID=46835 RepID=A0A504YL10_FASGI|nr:hypothetical protein FGIG_06685 [Fasciola gigantica]
MTGQKQTIKSTSGHCFNSDAEIEKSVPSQGCGCLSKPKARARVQASMIDSIARIRFGRNIRRRKAKFQFDRSDHMENITAHKPASKNACCNGHHNGRLPSVAGNRVKIDPDGTIRVHKLSKKRPTGDCMDLFNLPPIPYSMLLTTTPRRDEQKKRTKQSPYLIHEIDLNRLISPRCLPRLCELEPQVSVAEAEQCMQNYFSPRQASQIRSRPVIPVATTSFLNRLWHETKTRLARSIAPEETPTGKNIFNCQCQTTRQLELHNPPDPKWLNNQILPVMDKKSRRNADVVTIDLDVLNATVHCCV